MSGVVVVLGSLLNALIIGFVARRLVGAPVGWPRTIALSLVVNAAAVPASEGVLRAVRAPEAWASQAQVPAGSVAIVGLIVAWMLALEVIVLAALEAVVPTGTVPTPTQLLRGVPAGSRRMRRYSSILRIAARHGLGAWLRPGASARSGTTGGTTRVARSLREALTEGGVTFVKLGQMISTRPDLVGADVAEELSHLHSDVPPVPWTELEAVLVEELGRPVDEVFESVETEPLAAASVAQIHRARRLDGREVVVKVQRPGARRQVTADLDIVQRLAERLDRTTGWAPRIGVLDLARGFAASLEEELDYRVEVANKLQVAVGSPGLYVPAPHTDLSTRRLLVMDVLAGQPLSRAGDAVAALPLERRRELADRLMEAVLRQLTVTGVFHADLHPGNIVLTDDGELGLLDFGSVGRLDSLDREALTRLLLAVDGQDPIGATDALLELLDAPAELDDRALQREVGQLLVRYGDGHGPGGTPQLVTELFRVVVGHGLAVPAPMAAAFRSLGALEGSLRLLDPELDLLVAARRHAPAMLRSTVTPEALRQRALNQLASSLPALQRIPRRIDRITESLEAGRLTIGVRPFAHQQDRGFVTSAMQQLVVAVLAGALAIAGTVLVVSDHGLRVAPGLSFFTFLGFVLMLFGFVLGARAIVLVFRQRGALGGS